MTFEFEIIYLDGTTRIESIKGHESPTHQAAWFPLLRRLRDYGLTNTSEQHLTLENVATISPIK